MSSPNCIVTAAEDVAIVQELWTEYWATLGLSGDFQGFARELASLPGYYAPPAGRLLLAWVDGAPAGTGALRPLGEAACEAKRLYLRPAYRGLGLGRMLLDRLIAEARSAGHREMFCDTLPSMLQAQRLYADYGFTPTAPYAADPTPGALYFRLAL